MRKIILIFIIIFSSLIAMEQPVPSEKKAQEKKYYEPKSLVELSLDAVEDQIMALALQQDIIDDIVSAREENHEQKIPKHFSKLKKLLASPTVQKSSNLRNWSNNTAEQVKKFIDGQIQKKELPKPIIHTLTLLQKLPEDLQIKIIEDQLQKLDKNTIWLDKLHLIPSFIKPPEMAELTLAASATQKLIEFLVLEHPSDRVRRTIINLAFQNETSFDDKPLLTYYAILIRDENDETEKNKLTNVLLQLLLHATDQNKFDALYYLVIKIVTNRESTKKSTKIAQQEIEALKILLNAKLNPTVTNTEGQSVIQIIKDLAKPEITNLEIKSGNDTLKIRTNNKLVTRVLNLLKIHSKT